jgi:hypothetical protein
MTDPNTPSLAITLRAASLHVQTVADLQTALQELGVEVDTQHVLQLSYEPPAWVEVIASAPTWVQFVGAAAAIYVKALLEGAAKETWKQRKDLARAVAHRTSADVAKLKHFVRAIAGALAKSRRNDVRVSIVGSNMRFRLRLADEDQAIDDLARSVYLMQRIRKVVDEITDRVSENHLFSVQSMSSLKTTDL